MQAHKTLTLIITGLTLLLGPVPHVAAKTKSVQAQHQRERVTVKTAALPSPLVDHSCATDTASGKIYCFGGEPPDASWVLEYTPTTDTLVTKQATLPTPRWGLSCTAYAPTHTIYCFGGWTGGTSTFDEIVEYTPATDTLITKHAVLSPSGRALSSCVSYTPTGKIYCFGGFQRGANGVAYLDDILEYDPAADVMAVKIARLPHKVAYHSCAAGAGLARSKIYCFGGINPDVPGDQLDQIVEYTPRTDTLKIKAATLPAPTTTAHSCSATAAMRKIYCLGGLAESALDQIMVYNIARDVLTVSSATLPSPRSGSECAATTDAIYCFGGVERDSTTHQTHLLSEIVEYRPGLSRVRSQSVP